MGLQVGSSGGSSNGTTSGSSSGTLATTPSPTGGWQQVSDLLQGNLTGGGTGLNPGQTGALNYLTANAPNVGGVNYANSVLSQYVGSNNPAPQVGATSTVSAPAISGEQAKTYMGAYQNPWTQQVVDTTTNSANLAFRKALNDINANYGGSLGNGRAGVAAGQAASDYATNLAPVIAGLNSQGFNTALGAGQQDAAQAQAAQAANAANALTASNANAGYTQQANLANLAAQQANQAQSIGVVQDYVNNLLQSGQITQEQAQNMFNMAGGGNTNLMNFLSSQTPGFGTNTATSGQSTSTTTGHTNTGGSSAKL